jgi:predicted DNA-binding transcriptional regulator AlpA
MDTITAPQGATDEKGAAHRVGLSVFTLQRYRITGGGPKYAKLGRRVVYRVADLDEWVAARIVSSTSQGVAA